MRVHPTSPHPDEPGASQPTDRSNIARGRWGEDRAATEYLRLGYAILDRNWRSPTGELDLVVERDGVVVFAEVKTRRSDRYGPAAAAVGPKKQSTIRRLAVEWLDQHRLPRRGIRFDVVAITGVVVVVIESAF